MIVVATGAQRVSSRPSILYGQDQRVITQTELRGDARRQPDCAQQACDSVVMIQCVGSRDDGAPLLLARLLRRGGEERARAQGAEPRAPTSTSSTATSAPTGCKELYYRKAREQGVMFIRFDAETAARR